eukprot:gnl/Trimastix_PCT/1865.p1 GENE.gnl/Trimastix_PCT/1865~~gnl/Trimastix_PCT/1865.p1  ORF type:complete len:1904 (-),score=747.44 gnl/Trimastix_PCT/1865:385-6096(-)
MTFDFGGRYMTHFLHDVVAIYLTHREPAIRTKAACACARHVIPAGIPPPTRGTFGRMVLEILNRLLMLAVGDPDKPVRCSVLLALDSRFDNFLSQNKYLQTLFLLLNDDSFTVRRHVIEILGRLSNLNPARVLPLLRKTIIRVLTMLEYSHDVVLKQEAAAMLTCLIRSTPLVTHYIGPITKTLRRPIKRQWFDVAVTTCALQALGELAVVGGSLLAGHVDEFIPVVLESIASSVSSPAKRVAALQAFWRLIEATGYAIAPYKSYPQLLPMFTDLLKTSTAWSIRREVLKCVGVLGALDPVHEKALADPQEEPPSHMILDTDEPMVPKKDVYATAAVTALVAELQKESSPHYQAIISAIMVIVKALGLEFVPYLHDVVTPLFSVLSKCDDGNTALREFIFVQLSVLVSVVKQHMRPHLKELFAIIKTHWVAHLPHIITLIEQISISFSDEFKWDLPRFMSRILQQLDDRTHTVRILHTLDVFGRNLDDYLFLVVPAVVALLEEKTNPVEIQKAALTTITSFCSKLNVAEYATRILHAAAACIRNADGPRAELASVALETICAVARQLGPRYLVYVPSIEAALNQAHLPHEEYQRLIREVQIQSFAPSPYPLAPPRPAVTEDRTASTDAEYRNPELSPVILMSSWRTADRASPEDWIEWVRQFSIALLQNSPSPALRPCAPAARALPSLARDLFNPAFAAVCENLSPEYLSDLVLNLEKALSDPTCPPEILQTLLHLAEYMEHLRPAGKHARHPLPISLRVLANAAERCRAFAKALHYREAEFHMLMEADARRAPQPAPCSIVYPCISLGDRECVPDDMSRNEIHQRARGVVESLVQIHNELQHIDAAQGALRIAQNKLQMTLNESYFEKLHRWEDALVAYEEKLTLESHNTDLNLGKVRCFHALGETEKLFTLCESFFERTPDQASRTQMAPYAAKAAWILHKWQAFAKFLDAMDPHSIPKMLNGAVLAVHRSKYDAALDLIEKARKMVDTQLGAVLSEGYTRSYQQFLLVQQLAELEEVITYKKCRHLPERQKAFKTMWTDRLTGVQCDADTWKTLLAIRSLVLDPTQDVDVWVKYARLCHKAGHQRLARKTLLGLLNPRPRDAFAPLPPNAPPAVAFALLRDMHEAGEKEAALERLDVFLQSLPAPDPVDQGHQYAKFHMTHGIWLGQRELNEEIIRKAQAAFQTALGYEGGWHKICHKYAMLNAEAIRYYQRSNQGDKIEALLVPTVKAFFKAILYSPKDTLQDTLRLLTLWFRHGSAECVEKAMQAGFEKVNRTRIETWLGVIPQIIARLDAGCVPVRNLISQLLTMVGRTHPQVLIYPLAVASKSDSLLRKGNAERILQNLKDQPETRQLIEQALLISFELIRVAVLWPEMWQQGLEDASRKFHYEKKDIPGCLAALHQLHASLDRVPETDPEREFYTKFGNELGNALALLRQYERDRHMTNLNQAWEIYTRVFRVIRVKNTQIHAIELPTHSPRLAAAMDLDVAVPGIYMPNREFARIRSFQPVLPIIVSKQRPRKLSVIGSDGRTYQYLLKGHEDIRQDERVMQLFGLVNQLMRAHLHVHHLSIRQYPIVPLSPTSGLIGWVQGSDTLHSTVKTYRLEHGRRPDEEHRKILAECADEMEDLSQQHKDFELLTLMQKVEVFSYIMSQTHGRDLYDIFLLRSENAEEWLERRMAFTQSLAVMSMVGHILGLGDRHPSNLMLERKTGRLLHIDFGDCFEVAMEREKYAEKVPFRLTRMFVNAMEVSGIEGTFRLTCERVMGVLRENKGSVLAMLEAFVYDPIISWRLLHPSVPVEVGEKRGLAGMAFPEIDMPFDSLYAARPGASLSISVATARAPLRPDESDSLNAKAVQVMERVRKKLAGCEFGPSLSVHKQVDRLIQEAVSHENLCQAFVGWCPFW